MVFLTYAQSPHETSAIQEWVKNSLIPTGGVTVAIESERIVGVLAITEDSQAIWVNQLYVFPGFENRGVGSELIKLVHRSATKPVRLFTFQQNSGSRRFYERHGYRIVALSDGQSNEENCPDVLYEFSPQVDA